MKRRTLILILVLEAVLIAGLVVLTRLFPDLFTSVFAFPMEQIAAGLNALADTGAVGNGAALVLLAAIALVPSVFALRTPRGRVLTQAAYDHMGRAFPGQKEPNEPEQTSLL